MGITIPDWLPDEYDPNEDLITRLRVLARCDERFELVAGNTDNRHQLGELHRLEDRGQSIQAFVGGKPHSWEFEVTVSKSGERPLGTVRSVDLERDPEEYATDKPLLVDEADIRIYNVDDCELPSPSPATP